MVRCLEHGRGEFRGVALTLHLGHAEAGSRTGRLHEQRVLQSGLLDLGEDRLAVGREFGCRIVFASIQRDAGSDRNAGGGEQHLRVVLVHACRGSKHAAADVRHVHHFEQALDGAILAEWPVQHRKHRVHMAERGQRAVGFAGEETILAECHIQHHVLGAVGFLHDGQSLVHIPAARILAVDDPLAVLRDAHGNRLEYIGIQRAQHTGRGNAGDRMLIGLAAVHHHNALLSHVQPFVLSLAPGRPPGDSTKHALAY